MRGTRIISFKLTLKMKRWEKAHDLGVYPGRLAPSTLMRVMNYCALQYICSSSQRPPARSRVSLRRWSAQSLWRDARGLPVKSEPDRRWHRGPIFRATCRRSLPPGCHCCLAGVWWGCGGWGGRLPLVWHCGTSASLLVSCLTLASRGHDPQRNFKSNKLPLKSGKTRQSIITL